MLDGQENTLHVAAPPKTYTHLPRGQARLDSFLKSAPSCVGPSTSASAPEPLLDPDLVERSMHVVSSDISGNGQAYPPPVGANLKRNFDRAEYDASEMPSDNKRKRLF